MAFVRSIGRWTMTALVINCIIGGGIFGLPSELTRLLGRASPIAMIFSALSMAMIAALANLFVGYLGTFLPGAINTWQRSALMAILIAIPALANYRGVRTGAIL